MVAVLALWFSSNVRLSPGPITASVEAYDGDTRQTIDPSRMGVSLLGPTGREKAWLVPPPTPGEMDPANIGIAVERTAPAGWRTLTLDLRDTIAGGRQAKGNSTSATYYLPAKGDEEAVRELAKQWVGREAWLLGAGTWEALWDPRLPVTILGVERRPMGLTVLQGSFYWDYRFSDLRSGTFVAGDPLAIRVRIPAQGRVASGNMDDHGPIYRPLLPGQPGASKATEDTILVADPWHFARAVSFASPTAILSRESKAVASAFAARRIVSGMPRALVARIMGDPDVAFPRERVWRDRVWSYSMDAPHAFVIRFDAQGRVTSSELTGQLP